MSVRFGNHTFLYIQICTYLICPNLICLSLICPNKTETGADIFAQQASKTKTLQNDNNLEGMTLIRKE